MKPEALLPCYQPRFKIKHYSETALMSEVYRRCCTRTGRIFSQSSEPQFKIQS